jgi:hypothetical protein
MKRDMDLARGLLLAIEDAPGTELRDQPNIPGFSEEQVTYHLGLLKEAGLIDATMVSSKTDLCFIGISMTWSGHEFLDKVRDPEIWSTAKDGAKRVGSWSIGLLADLAKAAVMAKAHSLGLPVGG